MHTRRSRLEEVASGGAWHHGQLHVNRRIQVGMKTEAVMCMVLSLQVLQPNGVGSELCLVGPEIEGKILLAKNEKRNSRDDEVRTPFSCRRQGRHGECKLNAASGLKGLGRSTRPILQHTLNSRIRIDPTPYTNRITRKGEGAKYPIKKSLACAR